MNLFQNVKYGVNCREAAERYGVSVNRQGKALCPFHNDRHPSLYAADDHYHCFACGEHGDVIDFAAKLFGLPLYEAAQRLAADFHLTPDKPPSAAALHATASEQKHSSSEKMSGCAFLFYPITLVSCGAGRCSMRRNHQQKHRMSGLWKPVTSWTRRSITWIFLLPGIPMNAPKWSVLCLQMVGWTSSRKKSMGGMQREQEVCRAGFSSMVRWQRHQ